MLSNCLKAVKLKQFSFAVYTEFTEVYIGFTVLYTILFRADVAGFLGMVEYKWYMSAWGKKENKLCYLLTYMTSRFNFTFVTRGGK